MGVTEIIIIAVSALIVAAVIGVAVWKKATGKGGCCCDCSACAGCGKKHKKTKKGVCACAAKTKAGEKTPITKNKNEKEVY